MTITFNADLVERICRQATAHNLGNIVLSVLTDPLDDTVWVHFSSWPRASEARRALAELGISANEAHDARLHVTGWDTRLLRRRLGTVLAGVDDLTIEWDATAELANYHYDRRAQSGEEPDSADVLADVEATMRRAVPLPHTAPRAADPATLLDLIEAAEDAYEQLISRHIDHAEKTLARRCTLGAA